MGNLSAVIMAGGSGKRFWPLSRKRMPKQFLSFFESKSLIEVTIDRMAKIVGVQNVFIVMGKSQIPMFQEIVPSFPFENLIAEPCARDTAAAIGYSAVVISKMRPGSTIITAPADHLIDEDGSFQNIIKTGAKLAKDTGCLLTIGIKPSHPATGYGYIEIGEKISGKDSINAFEVRSFREKPPERIAESYLKSGSFFWNGGIFIWQPSVILEEISKHLPEMHKKLMDIRLALNTDDWYMHAEQIFPEIERISIDFGVLEKSKNILMIKGDFFWDDIGSWTSFGSYLKKDENNNGVKGLFIAEDANNCLVVSDSEKLTALSGVQDLIIVNTKDVTLVCNRNDDQGVKKLVEKLAKSEDMNRFL